MNLYRAITCDMQVATAAKRGDFVLHGEAQPLVAASSDEQAAELDSLPCPGLSPGARALLTGAIVCIDDVLDGADARDPWCALAVASDVTSVLSVPLLVPHGTVAAVTLFSEAADHFSTERREIAVALARAAADLVLLDVTRGRLRHSVDPSSAISLGDHRAALSFLGDLGTAACLSILRGLAHREARTILPAPSSSVRPRSDRDVGG